MLPSLFKKTPYFLKKTRYSPISLHKKRLHQDYYHPYDVPAYQTPTLGETKNPPQLSRQEIIYPFTNLDMRFASIDPNYTIKGQTFPQHSINQEPELFLPEEPTFLEFYGPYPFFIFAATLALSQEYFIISGHGHSSIIVVAEAILLINILIDGIMAPTLKKDQFNMDQTWVYITASIRALKKKIKLNEESLKNEQRARNFDGYFKGLVRRKMAFFARQKHIFLNKSILEKLQNIRSAEQNLVGQAKKPVGERFRELDQRVKSNGRVVEEYDRILFQTIQSHNAKYKSGKTLKVLPLHDLSGISKEMAEVWSKMDSETESEKDTEKDVPLDSETRNFLKRLHGILSECEVYEEKIELPDKVNLRKMGLVGKLTEKEKERDLVRNLKAKQLRVVQKEISRFKEGKAPKGLLELKKAFLNE